MARIIITRDNLTQELLKKLITYDPTTGVITRNHLDDDMSDYMSKRSFNDWNNKSNKRIGSISSKSNGYQVSNIKILGTNYISARIIWLYITGKWPEYQIDHKDGNSINNKWDNLRDVTASVNNRNRKLATNNKTGVVGVYEEKHVKGPNKWKAQAYPVVNGKKKHLSLGYHPTLEEAVAARKAWEDSQGDYTDRHGT